MGAFVTIAYVGWGFQVWMPTGPDRGIADVTLDGVDCPPKWNLGSLIALSCHNLGTLRVRSRLLCALRSHRGFYRGSRSSGWTTTMFA